MTSGTWDFTHNTSGKADVPTSESVGDHKLSGSHFIAISGTTAPNAAWYQSGLATVPNTQITFVVNTLYTLPANSALAPIQTSGTANVPKSESSITH